MTDTETFPFTDSFARAKVNLYLHVIGRCPNGYHILDSLVAFPEIGDRVHIGKRAQGLSLSVDGPFGKGVPLDASNSLMRAANALAEEARVTTGADIRLTKLLPVASGVGGGSADAAATLRALMVHWNLDLPPTRVAALALRLGADVPMCIASQSAFVGGIGEELEPPPSLPAFSLVLVNPGVELATAAVFGVGRTSFSKPARFSRPPADAVHFAQILAERGNDLTEAAVSLCPVIAQVLAALSNLEDALLVRMSGSGATCFALFAEPAAAERSAERLQQRHPDWWVAPALVAATDNSD
ncbi:MAG: 4-(cytidine 5'-diphospho)-2-C-methyl-D-erythritol kinase [Rhodospirillales bacterium]